MENNRRSGKEILSMVVMAGLVALALFVIFENREVTTEWLLSVLPEALGLRVAVVLLCFFLEGIIPFFSFNVIALASAMVFGTSVALAVNVAGALVSMVAPYFIGKYLGAPYVIRSFSQSPRLWQIYRNLDEISFVSSFVLRALGLSNIILGLLFGSLRMPFFSYLASGLLGMLPSLLCVTILGSQWDFSSPLLWGTLAINAAIVAGAYLYMRRRKG